MQKIYDKIQERYAKLSTLYSNELTAVTNTCTKLFPNDICMTNEELDEYRAMCLHSQNSLKRISVIASHRKILGPIIVLFKRLLLGILKNQLQDTFKSFNHSFMHSTINQAKLHVEIKRLKNNI